MRLDDASGIYAGSTSALAVYAGSTLVWPPAGGGGTYARVRLVVTRTHGAPTPMIAALAVRASVAGADLAGTAVASSVSGALTSAPNAFDGDANTWWEPALGQSNEPYVGLLLEASSAIAEIAITFPNVESLFVDAAPRDFRVDVWTGGTWIEHWSETDVPAWSPGETRTFTP